MTHHTDAEQLHQLLELVLTELDRKAIPIAYMQEIDRKGKAFIEQAARRAPAAPVPQGWKLVPVELLERIQESLGSFVSDQGWSQSDMDTADALDGLLAAAPQPPEAQGSASNVTLAVRMQMPEPVAFVHTPAFAWNGNISPVVSFAKYEDDYKSGIYSLRTPLYTEQQLRELLTAHGIQEQST